LPPVDADVAQR